MQKIFICTVFILLIFRMNLFAIDQIGQWRCYEKSFTSSVEYANPLYEVKEFKAEFQSPCGRVKTIRGFWDGGREWKIRFCPDETGTWTFTTICSDEKNSGLHQITDSFECVRGRGQLDIYNHGVITHPKGSYHLTYADGTPFFWVACTAWNGALLSTEAEWDQYLEHRAKHGYSVIQFVTTQWRGAAANRLGQVAFTGCGRIQLNVDFFKYMDQKIQRINDYGLVAAPVLLWALPFGQGMELSPGYYLPEREAILLARYMVARFGGYHVVWILGGDGKYVDDLEQRWKNIGRGVFGDEHPGLVAQHPMGRSWIGQAYKDEAWLDIVGYQSSHSNAPERVDWINKGPMSQEWGQLPPKPIINLEPNYEEIRFKIKAVDVRNACWWSVFATPPAGITYGANGIWPWIREGDTILNHRHAPGVSPWYKSIDFPGSIQIGYLGNMLRQYPWWRLKPAPEILAEQPGEKKAHDFIAVVKTDSDDLIMAYVPGQLTVKLFNPRQLNYKGKWFDPVNNQYAPAKIGGGPELLELVVPGEGDFVLVLQEH